MSHDATTPDVAGPAVEPGALQRLSADLGGEREVIVELVTLFLGEAPRMLDAMRNGAASGDVAAVNRAAHSLKSSAGTFGAARLAGLCRELEHLTIAKLPRDAVARADAISAEWARVRASLEAFLA